MSRIRLPNNWQPRAYQRKSWNAWERGCKRSLLIWHRRAGKDDVALHKGAVGAHERVANYWHMLPQFNQARRAIWEAVNPHSGKLRIDEAFPHELRSSTNNTSMTIKFKNGSVWQVVGSDNPDSLVGAPPFGIVFSEWALSNPSAWAYLAPILEENGGWAEFITTPRGRNHCHSMLKMAQADPWSPANPHGWFSEVLPVSVTGAMAADAIERQRREYHGLYGPDAGDAMIEQEFFCSFEAAILGAYWGKDIRTLEDEGRLTTVPVDEKLPVHTAWDLGIGDSMALWFFQVTGRELRIVDWYEANGQGLDHYAQVKRDKGYGYGDDFVPHDAKVRELGTGRTRIETMIGLKLRPRLVALHKVDDGINAVRLSLPSCWIDTRCEDGVERLRQYKRDWDDDKKCFLDKPRHDWTSHSADAFRYLCMAWRELAAPKPPKPESRLLGVGDHNTVSFNDMLPKGLRFE